MKNCEVWAANNSGNFNCKENGEHFLVYLKKHSLKDRNGELKISLLPGTLRGASRKKR